MRRFTHIDARTVSEALSLLERYEGKAVLNAGGSDLLSILKQEIFPEYPEAVINIKGIPGLDAIEESPEGLRIGALARLCDLEKSPLVASRWKVLATAARSVASPQVRNVATLGGNLCQDVRCWYYRYPRQLGGPLGCARKKNGPCLAVKGDNRYHAILGGGACFAVCPSDTAVALAVLDASLVIAGREGERRLPVVDFFTPLAHAISAHEMVTAVEVPRADPGATQTFLRFTLRSPIDFAIVSVATAIGVEGPRCTRARVAIGAVAPGPVRASKAEEFLNGRSIDPPSAAHAAELALAAARPLSMNSYKVEIAKTLVRRAVLS